MAERRLPPPVTTDQAYLAAVLDAVSENTDEVKGLRADLARSPSQPARQQVELREPVTARPGDDRPAAKKTTGKKATGSKKTSSRKRT